MKVIADICIIPITGRISVRKEVSMAHTILKETGLPVQLHSYGTNIEGEFDIIMAALKDIFAHLHETGTPRVTATIKIGSRIDKEQSMQDKIDAVQAQGENL